MLKSRLITAGILIVFATLLVFLFPPTLFSISIAGIVALAAWEWAGLCGFWHPVARIMYLIATGIVMLLMYYVSIFFVLWVVAFLWLWILVALIFYSYNREPLGLQFLWVRMLLGIILLPACWLSADIIRESANGHWLFLFVLMLVWAVDTGAYFVGRYKGKHLLASKISPKKTWEGFAGGLALAFMVSLVVALSTRMNVVHTVVILFLSIVVGIFAVMGDLLESLFKRQAGVKDSGNLLPGHGGILDRLDGAIAAIPIFTLLALLLAGA